MQITINGTPQTFDSADLSLGALLDQLKIDPGLVVIELNHTILPPEAFSSASLKTGDVIELIQFVGGG